jgi:hypothetical protein
VKPERGLPWFEGEYRQLLEAEFAFADVDPNAGSLGYGPDAKRSFLAALQAHHPAGHWAGDAANYPSVDDLALQFIFAAARRLAPDGQGGGGGRFDACLRVIRSPAISPYVLTDRGIVVIPRGFLASVDSFVTTILELSLVGVRLCDPTTAVGPWGPERIVLGQSQLAVDKPFEYAFGIIVALQPTLAALVVTSAPPALRAALYRKAMYDELNAMMPVSQRFAALGFGKLGEILPKTPAVHAFGIDLRRLVACVAICHEMGHLMVDEAARATEQQTGEEAVGPDNNESLADAMGMLLFYRMKEAGLLALLLEGRPVTHGLFVNALAAFNAWSLAIQIGGLDAALSNRNESSKAHALGAITHVAARWKKCGEILTEAEGDEETDGQLGFAKTVWAGWSFPCAELLRQVFLKGRRRLDCDDAFRALYVLDDPDSEIFRALATLSYDPAKA